MKIAFKRTAKHAVMPKKANAGDAGYDLAVCDGPYYNPDYDYIEYGTGIKAAIPEGYVGLLFPRSSISKTPLALANCVGVIDPPYRGEIKMRFKRWQEQREDQEYVFGDRVGQLVIVKTEEIEWEEVDELPESVRGEGGFGSSGR